jgi:hypothetical protein
MSKNFLWMMPAFFFVIIKIGMGEPLTYLDPQKARDLNPLIAKQKPTILLILK